MAFLLWGVLPVYWKALQNVPASEILAHRIVWSLVFGALLLGLRRRRAELFRALRTRSDRLRVLASATLLGVNWFTYVWAVNHDFILECSLGYYITPLVNVLLGRVFLSERLRPWQIVAFALAAAGVLNLLVAAGRVPWIALVLAGTFGFYALGRKTSRLESLPGLVVDTTLLSIPALGYLGWLYVRGAGGASGAGWATWLLLAGAGAVTATPLILFAYGARRITLATVGFLQYIGPTGAFLLGVLVYKEPFGWVHAVTFGLIWAGLAIYSWDSVRRRA